MKKIVMRLAIDYLFFPTKMTFPGPYASLAVENAYKKQ